jgi:hypothetical protein
VVVSVQRWQISVQIMAVAMVEKTVVMPGESVMMCGRERTWAWVDEELSLSSSSPPFSSLILSPRLQGRTEGERREERDSPQGG